jgi:uncharacterized protein YegL
MKENTTTHYLMVLDKSGSMANAWDATMSSLNEQIQSIRNLQKKNQDIPIRANLITFNDEVNFNFLDVPAAHLEDISKSSIEPEGMTALLDAAGKGIDIISERKSREDDVVCIIITDGMENASQLYSFNMIAEKIKQKKATGKWTFVILGADFDVWEMGRKLNIDDNKRMRYEKTRTHQTFSDMNMMMQEYVSLKKEGRLKDAYDLSKNKK